MPRISAISDGSYPAKWRSTSRARCCGSRRRKPRSSWSRSAADNRSSGPPGRSSGRARRLLANRRLRTASWRHERTTRRWSHASNRSGSRSPGRSRQAITSASWRASSVRSTSRRIRCAIAKRRSPRVRIRSAYASLSPRRARSTRSRSTHPSPRCAQRGRRPNHYGSAGLGRVHFSGGAFVGGPRLAAMPEIDLTLQLNIALRLLLSAVLGAVIGYEREIHDHPAGMRTHLLVSLGSAAFTVVSIYGFSNTGIPNEAPTDPSRVAAQIVTGIGFLGAGAIIKYGTSVRGLTTAASLWVTAAVGMAVGAGWWLVAIVTTGIVVLSLWPLRLIIRRIRTMGAHQVRVRLQTTSLDALGDLRRAVGGRRIEVTEINTQRQAKG